VKLSKRSEYACLALVDLTEHKDQGYIPTAVIASRQGVPPQYLEQILLILKRAGYVRSRRGTGGGYRLAKSPDSITIAEVLRLLDGALAPVESVSTHFYEPTPISRNEPLTSLFREIRDFVADKLESTTFDDLAGPSA
jgi:Rrf2 family cysteine metabolism transcriptional repressor